MRLAAAFILCASSWAVTIDYPPDGAVFPPEITAPTFLWSDPSSARAWRIDIQFADGSAAIQARAAARNWTPDAALWAAIKDRSTGRPATVTITAESGGSAQVRIETSRDPAGAPIFYRQVPLMPSEVEPGVIKPLAPQAIPLIAWRLRYLDEPRSRQVLEGIHSCTNCHSFSRDGKTLAPELCMD